MNVIEQKLENKKELCVSNSVLFRKNITFMPFILFRYIIVNLVIHKFANYIKNYTPFLTETLQIFTLSQVINISRLIFFFLFYLTFLSPISSIFFLVKFPHLFNHLSATIAIVSQSGTFFQLHQFRCFKL